LEFLKMELYRKNILFILVFTLCAFISVPAFVWIVDPFHIYHRDTWLNRDKYYSSAESFNNFIQLKYLNTCDMFDAVLIGNSRTCAFDSIDLKKALPKCKGCIKLTINGCVTSEHTRSLQKAIKSKKIKNVVFMDPPDIIPQSQNRIVLPSLRNSLFRRGSMFVACLHVIDLFNCFPHDKLGLVQLNKVHSYLPENTKEFGKISLKLHLKKRVFTIDDTVPTDIPDNQLLFIIRKYSNITFHLLFPLYSNIFFDTPTLDWKSMSFFVKNTKDLSNVKIYDFHDVPHFYISRNWTDICHFSPVFNKFMTYCIEHNLHRVTAKNYDAYKQHVLDVLKSFNPSDYPERPTTFEELVAYEESLHPELKEQKVSVEEP